MTARLAIAATIALVAHASAGPRVDLDHCDAFDARALRAAIDRELPTDLATQGRDFAVIVTCPDLVTATLRVVPGDVRFARTIDLGEVPTELRIKLLALTVAEFVQIVASAPPPEPVAIAPPGSQWHRRPTTPPPPDPGILVQAEVPSAHTITWSIDAAARIYTSTPRPLAELELEFGIDGFRLGLRGAAGETSSSLGTIHPWLATLTVARAIVCSAQICVLARAEGGIAVVTARADTAVTSSDAREPYGQLGLAAELVHRFDGWTLLASLDAGWAEGLIARSGGTDAVALAGAVLIGGIGARWR